MYTSDVDDVEKTHTMYAITLVQVVDFLMRKEENTLGLNGIRKCKKLNIVFRNEANSLIIERDILTKTIFRVYQKDSNLTKIQRDKLLTRYQHQLAVVVTKIEEIGNAMRNTGTNHSDEGTIRCYGTKIIEDR